MEKEEAFCHQVPDPGDAAFSEQDSLRWLDSEQNRAEHHLWIPNVQSFVTPAGHLRFPLPKSGVAVYFFFATQTLLLTDSFSH